jgi:hypothetical protein
MSFNFLLDHVKIVASTNEEVLLCHAYHRPWYYMGNPTTKQWQKISNMKTRYDTIEFDMMVERSNPLYYKIVRFLKPKFCPHDKELYMYHCIRVKLFDSKTWRWKLLDEVKLPQEESLCRMKKNISEWFTSLAYLEKKHICIWCEKGRAIACFHFLHQLLRVMIAMILGL